jgi:protein-tyrosine-phosphatase
MTTMILTIASLLIADGQSSRSAAASPSIVFVCEHGAAKSVIATAYFNKLAEERGLPYRATFRGTSPQDELSTRAIAGLRADGVAIPAGKPAAIAQYDVARATHIFAIGCTSTSRSGYTNSPASRATATDRRRRT